MLTLCLSEEDSEGRSDRRRSSSAGIGHVRDAGVKHTSAELISRRQKIQDIAVTTRFSDESFTGHIYSKAPPPHCV